KQWSTEDRRKVTAAICSRWNRRGPNTSNKLASSLIVAKKECLRFDDRTADHTAELIAAINRLGGIGRSRRSKKVARVQCFVAEELECGAVEIISPGLCRKINYTAVESAKLGGRCVDLDLEFLNSVDHRTESYLSGLGLQSRNTVKQILVSTRTSTVNARKRR